MAKLACDLLCQRMRRMRQYFASICGACGSTLLAYAAHTVANCQRRWRIRQQNREKMSFCKRMLRMRQQIASVCGACSLCQRKRRMRQQLASVGGAYGGKLQAYAPHTVALCQRRRRMRLLKQKGILGERLQIVTASKMLVNSFPTWEAERTRIRIIL